MKGILAIINSTVVLKVFDFQAQSVHQVPYTMNKSVGSSCSGEERAQYSVGWATSFLRFGVLWRPPKYLLFRETARQDK